ncbi:MAG: hypothetical protein QOJ63_2589 [Solirubrobacteraceae bacterium]|nr:hypothetical protein [Solirubrobacteraceae bacterium]
MALSEPLKPWASPQPAGGGGGAVAPSDEYSSRFGEPAPGLVTLPAVAEAFTTPETVAGEAAGLPCRYSAATPATCGVAIDVPLIVLVAVSDVYQEDWMLDPGANRSTQVPKFENDERASVDVAAATVSALATRAGEVAQASALSFPAATA